MTLTAIAEQLGVSTMTVYRRCKKSGVNIADLRDPVTGEVSPDGVHVISALFSKVTAANSTQSATEGGTQTPQPITDSETRCAILETQLEAAKLRIQMLENERDRLVNQLDRLADALAREQDDRQRERLLLTGDTTTGNKKGLFRRLFGR